MIPLLLLLTRGIGQAHRPQVDLKLVCSCSVFEYYCYYCRVVVWLDATFGDRQPIGGEMTRTPPT